MIVNAWNPSELDQMALPPCHYSWQAIVTLNHQGEKVLNLTWNQRSVDTMLGLPYNIASYALLLLLLAKESNMIPGILMGSLGDVHIYENHIDGAKEQISREPKKLPILELPNFTSIWDWKYTDFELVGYESHPKLSFEIAV
jgi:thymidylate synthase